MAKIDLKEKLMFALLISIALKTDALVVSIIILGQQQRLFKICN